MEAFLITGHNAHNAVPVQIIGDIADFQVAAAELVERKVKQGPVVGLEMNLAAVAEYRGVLVQESAIGQTQFGRLIPGPGVAEIEIEQVHFPIGKEVRQHGGIGVDEKDVGEMLPHGVFHGHNHGVGDLFQGDEQHIRLGLGRLHGEFTLAAADFQTNFFCSRHQVLPVALEGGGITDPDAVAGFHPGAEVGLFSHSHRAVPHKSQYWVHYTQFQQRRKVVGDRNPLAYSKKIVYNDCTSEIRV